MPAESPLRLLVVEPDGGCPLDRLGGQLREALPGALVTTCRPWAGDAVPPRPAADGLVVLGGQMGAHDDDLHPWLADVRSLLAAAVEDAAPTLGICLGAQLLAAAAGGTVERGAHGREAGVVDVAWRPEAADDPLLGGLAGSWPGPSMHQDAVTALPPGAAWLGAGDLYPHQAFRVGPAAWGVQFHPEVTVPVFGAWARLDLPDPDRAAAVTAELADRDAEVAAAGAELARRFARLVRRRAVPA
ncbi:type 1 glutamine amidotransferase [Vallicoccus soli]|uniref:Type 1 glutamine amidotransferase n=1 Tax=Vallicoccus soli TaxID=2339232 RepID=A0A3A3Z8P8_9ACTN|nr:type 1 glutamine amidotransferase [Vallicoccus soli]RJK97217.1 type 1 glutamine amidotransferase [Vallicoccus soli]